MLYKIMHDVCQNKTQENIHVHDATQKGGRKCTAYNYSDLTFLYPYYSSINVKIYPCLKYKSSSQQVHRMYVYAARYINGLWIWEIVPISCMSCDTTWQLLISTQLSTSHCSSNAIHTHIHWVRIQPQVSKSITFKHPLPTPNYSSLWTSLHLAMCLSSLQNPDRW